MDPLNPTESVRMLRLIVSTLVLLLVASNVIWFIAYTTATGPLTKASPTITVTPSTATLTPSPTDIGAIPTPTGAAPTGPTPTP